MKQYLLLLKSGDFNKSGNTWASNAINLYSNNQYVNYSYHRSRYGLNLIGDNTYVGTEITSPSYNLDPATPLSDNAIYVTNIGEIVYEPATPSLLRFVDTTSRIDVLAYRHVFTNLPGTEVPTFNIQMYESDSENGPWLKSSLSYDSNVIFIRNCKPWIKIELEIFAENININDLGLLFYLEIGIHTPTSAVISEKTRNILKRFPTWMDLYADSENPATPSLKIPSSTAGKFLTALLQESIDDFDNQLSLYDINHYISSANEDMTAWAYVCYNVPVNVLSVIGDGIKLIQADSLEVLYRSKATDYIYYYNIIDKQIISLRQFNQISINSQNFEQYPIQIFNDFDEFGLRMGLARLFLESNARYKKRILDVSQNLPVSSADGFKRTVRRELDIWKAYGLEPDSSYLGATPDIIEVSDMEKTTPWFSFSGKPLQPFIDIVRNLNEKYPSNYGYVKWNEGYWDYGGIDGEGISRLPAIYDVDNISSPQYYQPGVGDFSDARLILESDEKSTISFSGLVKVSGTYLDGVEKIHSPITVDYNWYLSYLRTVPDYTAGRADMSRYLYSYRVNYVANPSFEVNTFGWSATTGTTLSRTTADKYIGIASLQAQSTTATSTTTRVESATPITVQPLKRYTVSAYAKLLQGNDRQIGIGLRWLNSAGTELSAGTSINNFVFGEDWKRISFTGEAPALAASAKVALFNQLSNASTLNYSLFDAVLFEVVPDNVLGIGSLGQVPPEDYFDASYNPVNNLYYKTYWTGTAHNSYSKIDKYVDIGVGLTYEIQTKVHGQYPTPTTFYANLNYLSRDDFYVGNRFLASHPSSPEYNLIRVFNDDGYTVSSLTFRDKQYNNVYYNTVASPNINSINFSDVSSVKIVFSNGGWNYVSSSYDKSLPTANYRASFTKSTPSTVYYVQPEYASQAVLSSPSFTYKDANIKIGSTVYATKSELSETQKIKSALVLNNSNDLTSTGVQNYILYTNTLLDKLVYPLDATPVSLYIDTIKPSTIPYFNGTEFINNIYGGVTIDPYDGQRYLVPSSPNIVYNKYNSLGEKIDSQQYFDSVIIDYYATPSYMIIESATSSYYPITYPIYKSFDLSTTPGIFSGYIDSLDNVYKNNEEIGNTFFNSDDFLSKIYISKKSFNLDDNIEYNIKDVQIISDTKFINAFVTNKDELISDTDTAFRANAVNSFDLRIKKDPQEIAVNKPAIHTGWIYENNKEYYAYSDPITESATGRFFSLKLQNTPRSGAPIIVKVGENEYRNAVISNSATPDLASFINLETVYGNKNNALYLAYENIDQITVQDSHTGIVMFKDLDSATGYTECFSDATPSVEGRAYYVEYRLKDSWHVDKNVYNSSTDQYESFIYFSSTPNTNQVYAITYENSLNDNTLPIDLSISPSVNPIDEGYVYMSTKDYDFSTAELKLSPSNISNSKDDLMYLTVISYDSNNNFKPGQTFKISGSLISATPQYVTTNDNGLASAIIRYAYTGNEYYESGSIEVSGVGSTTPNGSVNSSSQNYSKSIPFNINIKQPSILKVKAIPSSLIINSGEDASISINGQMYWKGQPWQKSMPVAWNKARTLVDLFAATPDYISYTNSEGFFSISNVATAQDTATPGYWFARVSVNNPDYVEQLLVEDGEIVSAQDLTISGDIIYWYESYDTVQYSEEALTPLPNIYTSNKQQNSNIISTPNFVYKHSDSNTIIYNNSTPNWRPPRWVPLSRFDQYQMGILGSTPNTISNYDALHPDYEET